MAINQSMIARDSVSRTVAAVTALCNALDTLESINETLTCANINLVDFSTEIEGIANIAHCDPQTVKEILSGFAPSIVTGLKALYSGTPTKQAWSALMSVRT
jgi:hypothetical protein